MWVQQQLISPTGFQSVAVEFILLLGSPMRVCRMGGRAVDRGDGADNGNNLYSECCIWYNTWVSIYKISVPCL